MRNGTPTGIDRTNRRRFLATLGAGSIAMAAGCTDQVSNGGGDDGGENDSNGNGTAPEGEGDGDGNGESVVQPAITHGELVSDFDGDLDEWFALEGEMVADEEEFLTGSRTVRIEGDGASAGIARSYPDGLNMEGQHLSLAVRVATPRPARVTVRILAPGLADQVWSTRTILSPYEGWLRMDVGYTGQRGEPFLDDVQEIQITLDDPNAATGGEEETEEGTETAFDEGDAEGGNETGGNETGNGSEGLTLTTEPLLQMENETGEEAEGDGIRFWVDDLRMTPQASQGYVMLVFDDNVRSQYENAFPLFQERDMQGVAAVIPPTLNRPPRLTIDQLREMRDAGWDVSAQSERSQGLAEMEPEEAREALQSDQEYLDNRGFPDGARSHFVPFHNVNQEVVDIVREYYELNSYFGGTPNAVPFTDPMHLSRVNMFDLDAFTSMIDVAAQHNQLAIGLAHGVVPEDEIEDDPLADMTVEQLEELLDYIEQSDAQLVTASDLIDNQDDL
ncbi:polysaccharide deacetylase family protein [Halalkalicoccus ordinarius]|uniref:polysaccharide deacetylase family protein n=1 Tax=Halalkalicoccus ordinarius TaxID=3116651 RepID=UPI00300F0A6D